jgi:hypothetical protein
LDDSGYLSVRIPTVERDYYGRYKDVTDGKELIYGQQPVARNVGIVQEIMKARGCLKVRVASEVGVVLTSKTRLSKEEVSIVHSATVFFAGKSLLNTLVKHEVLFKGKWRKAERVGFKTLLYLTDTHIRVGLTEGVRVERYDMG